MTANITEVIDKYKMINQEADSQYLSLIQKYKIDFLNFPIISNENYQISFKEKMLVIEKLLQAHELAKANVEVGNITGRGFATNICTMNNIWALGTNFNNTRNDISSICGERSAIISAYNNALIEHLKNENKEFEFKIKFLCMAQSVELDEIEKSAVPCEDCLSWLNTNRIFDDETIIFSFEKNQDKMLSLRITKLSELLPFKNVITSNVLSQNKKIEYSISAKNSMQKFELSEEEIKQMLNSSFEAYINNNLCNVSGQKIACSILANDKIYTAKKLDWTKRWHVEALEFATYKAIEENGNNVQVKIISYFGDETSKDGNNDGLLSIKSLGRIRQKYATNDTILILNLKNNILVTTIGEYLPKKFEQGYKIK